MDNDKAEDRLKALERMALELNAAMPTDVMLKGDGSIWITVNGNDGVRPHRNELASASLKTSEK